MAFTIKRHSLEDVGAMKNAAAQAKTNVAVDTQNREFAFREQSQMVALAAGQQLKEQDFANRLQIAGMTQEMNKEAAVTAHQLDLQRIELIKQNDFDRMMAEQNMISDRIVQNKMARAEEMQNRLTALDKAYKNGDGDISPSSYEGAVVNLLSGYRTPAMDPMEQMLQKMMTGGPTGGTQQGMAPQAQPQTSYPEPEQMQQMMTQAPTSAGVTSLQHLSKQTPYKTVTSKWPWVKDKQEPNIPVMKAKLTLATGSTNLTDLDKQAILHLLQTGSDRAIEEAWITLTAQVETGNLGDKGTF